MESNRLIDAVKMVLGQRIKILEKATKSIYAPHDTMLLYMGKLHGLEDALNLLNSTLKSVLVELDGRHIEQKPVECIPDSVKFDEGFKTGREIGFREGVESVKPVEWSERHIADVFEKVGLAKIVREQGNDNLTNALQSAMIELASPVEWSEAAGEYLDGHKPLSRYNWGDLMDAFKAGAEWMAGQGVTSTNVSILELPVELYQKCVEVGMTSADKVIVNIRKK